MAKGKVLKVIYSDIAVIEITEGIGSENSFRGKPIWKILFDVKSNEVPKGTITYTVCKHDVFKGNGFHNDLRYKLLNDKLKVGQYIKEIIIEQLQFKKTKGDKQDFYIEHFQLSKAYNGGLYQFANNLKTE